MKTIVNSSRIGERIEGGSGIEGLGVGGLGGSGGKTGFVGKGIRICERKGEKPKL
jgi:hypothetical protein